MTLARDRHRASMLAVLLVAPFLAQADATIANVATPAIRAGLITGARLGQTHGYKRLFLAGPLVPPPSSGQGTRQPSPRCVEPARPPVDPHYA